MPKYKFNSRKALLAYQDLTRRLSGATTKVAPIVAKRPRISTGSPQLVASYNPNATTLGVKNLLTTADPVKSAFPISQIVQMQPTKFDPYKSTLYPSHPSEYVSSDKVIGIPDFFKKSQYKVSEDADQKFRYASLMDANGGGDQKLFEEYTMPAFRKGLEQAARLAGVPGTEPLPRVRKWYHPTPLPRILSADLACGPGSAIVNSDGTLTRFSDPNIKILKWSLGDFFSKGKPLPTIYPYNNGEVRINPTSVRPWSFEWNDPYLNILHNTSTSSYDHRWLAGLDYYGSYLQMKPNDALEEAMYNMRVAEDGYLKNKRYFIEWPPTSDDDFDYLWQNYVSEPFTKGIKTLAEQAKEINSKGKK